MRTLIWIALVILWFSPVACRNQTSETTADTDTISPATPEHNPASTDAVTTQTVDITDIERSGAEGEGATEPLDTTGTTTTTATTPPTATTP